MDLVEIAPNAEPPVCKVMDYRKYKYEQDRKAKAARKKQVRVEVKEMKFRPKIDVGDYETKKRHIVRFLKGGNKVKVTIMFRGREMAHPERGLDILERLTQELEAQADAAGCCGVPATPLFDPDDAEAAPRKDGDE